MKIAIPLLMGSNGKWMSNGPEKDCDWGLMADCIMDDDKDPACVRRYMVHVTIDVPDAVTTVEADTVENAR